MLRAVQKRSDEQRWKDQTVDNVKESVQMMDEPSVEDQAVHDPCRCAE